MKPESMTHVSILCPKAYMERVIATLYDLSAYHIIDHQKTQELDIGKSLPVAEKLAEILVKLRGVMAHLTIKPNGSPIKPDHELTEKEYYELGRKSKELYLEVVGAIEKQKEARETVKRTREKLSSAAVFERLGVEPSMLYESRALCWFIGMLPEGKSLYELDAITNDYELVKGKEKQGQLIALFAKKEYKEAIQSTLQSLGFQETTIDQAFFENGKTIKRLIEEFKAAIQKAERVERTTEGQLEGLRAKHKAFLIRNEAMLREESKKAEAPLLFGETQKAFMVSGWVPTAKLVEARQKLTAVTKGNIFIDERKPGHQDIVPIKLHNIVAAKPYEFFLRLYELPSYKEIDPTILLFITFPLFFGFMLGDVGYGIVTLAIFSYLYQKLPVLKQLLSIMIFASAISILFGFMFGEYFGIEHLSYENGNALCNATGVCLPIETIEAHGQQELVADFPRLLNRAHGHVSIGGMNVLAVLVLGTIIGIIHLNLALLLGFYNTWRAHGLTHAVLEKASWIILEAGVAIIALSLAGLIAVPVFVGVALLLIAIVLIYKGEHIKGLVELPSLFSNILSYTRLGAVGLASVGLAVVVNENLAMPFIEKGGVFIILGIIILVIGHVINIGLGILGPFLHSLRLHYVEFFSKFYHGGGIPYKPFGYPREE